MHSLNSSSEMEAISQSELMFIAGTDRTAVRREIQGLNADELINYWSTFEPTPELAFPSACGRHGIDDIAAVLSGSKPAAMFVLEPDDFDNSLFADMFDRASAREDLVIREMLNFNDGTSCLVGNPESVEILNKLYRDARSSDQLVDNDFHIAVGTALGYPRAAIDNFLARIR